MAFESPSSCQRSTELLPPSEAEVAAQAIGRAGGWRACRAVSRTVSNALVENEEFARQMEDQYLQDLSNATEVILDPRRRVRAPGEPRHRVPVATSGGGSGGRAAAGGIRIGHAVGAAFADRRVFQPLEARFILVAGLLLISLAALFARFPKTAAYPLAAVLGLIGLAILYRAYKLWTRTEQKSGLSLLCPSASELCKSAALPLSEPFG